MTEHHAPPSESRSTAELINDLGDQTRRLIRDETRLAVLEIQGKGKRFALGAGMAGAGSLLAFYGGATLTATAVIALALTLSWWLSALIVALALLAVGGALALAGKKSVEQAMPLLPQDTAAGVERDIAAIKERSTR